MSGRMPEMTPIPGLVIRLQAKLEYIRAEVYGMTRPQRLIAFNCKPAPWRNGQTGRCATLRTTQRRRRRQRADSRVLSILPDRLRCDNSIPCRTDRLHGTARRRRAADAALGAGEGAGRAQLSRAGHPRTRVQVRPYSAAMRTPPPRTSVRPGPGVVEGDWSNYVAGRAWPLKLLRCAP